MMDKNKEKIKSLVKELGIINLDPDSVDKDFEEDIINALLAVKNYNAEHPEVSL